MKKPRVLSIQISSSLPLEDLSNILGVEVTDYDQDRDEDGMYEYLFGRCDEETIEIGRSLEPGCQNNAGITSHNNPAFFSDKMFGYILETFTKNGIKVVSYQNHDLEVIQYNGA